MKIFTQIKNSIYNKEFYNTTVLNQPLRESVKYLAKLTLIVSLFGVIIFSFSIPNINKEIKKSISSFVSNYPEDLVVSINNGNTTINREEPYIVKMPVDLIESNNSKPLGVDNFLIINTLESFSLDKFHSDSTLFLITKTDLVSVKNRSGEITILSLSEFGNIEINKNFVLEKEILIYKILPWIIIAMIPLAYIGIFIGIFVGNLIILFFYAVLAWIILKIKGIKIDYKKSYQIALHASTLLLIIGIFNSYLGILNNILVKFLILSIIVYINFDKNSNPAIKEDIILESKDEEIKD
jgi:hypothetical protein